VLSKLKSFADCICMLVGVLWIFYQSCGQFVLYKFSYSRCRLVDKCHFVRICSFCQFFGLVGAEGCF
jgi:hypothetical protein